MQSKSFLKNSFYLLMISSLLWMICQCKNGTRHTQQEKVPITEIDDSAVVENVVELYIDTLEVFVDSTSFGVKGKTKIELRRIDTDTSSTIHLRLFTKQLKKWNQFDEFVIPNNALMAMQPEIEDFNGDGYYDVLFTTGTAARGVNDIQTLVIFDPKRTKLIWVKNSESFPNMRYNVKLHCIDAWSVYGGEMTHFLRLKGDSLVEFASVEHYDHRIIAEVIDSKGKQRELKNISEKEMGCDFCRFVNYSPIEVAE